MKQDKFRNRILPLVDKLFRLALSITGNKQDAEDVVQDTLFKVWKKKDEWDSIHNLEAYCYRSTRNIAIDKISLKENQQEALDERYDIPETNANIQVRLEQEEQLHLLETFIRKLPEKQRTIFQLREIEEMTYKEIAEVMRISEEQVKVNLFRSRQKLKEFFNGKN
ncbi:MAG: RNA polymerase sigma factor [Candidatus Symbiothrix sp.]|jgi:RNA polymerase sigma-70 factor (ECF subfamily)|nr:RNA polymerase sigma factor [Candidatus Symbiothrix sp.]